MQNFEGFASPVGKHPNIIHLYESMIGKICGDHFCLSYSVLFCLPNITPLA